MCGNSGLDNLVERSSKHAMYSNVGTSCYSQLLMEVQSLYLFQRLCPDTKQQESTDINQNDGFTYTPTNNTLGYKTYICLLQAQLPNEASIIIKLMSNR